MAYSQLPTRTTADSNSAADVNQLQDNVDAILGSEAASGPAVALNGKVTGTQTIETAITDSDTKIPTSGAVVDYTGIDRIDIGDGGAGVVSMLDLTGKFGNATASNDRYTFTVAGKYLIIIWAEQGVTQFILAKDGGGLVTHNLAASNDLSLTYPLIDIAVNNYLTATWAGSSFGGYMWVVRIGA